MIPLIFTTINEVMIVETVKIQIPKEDSGDLVLIDKSTLSKQIYLNTH